MVNVKKTSVKKVEGMSELENLIKETDNPVIVEALLDKSNPESLSEDNDLIESTNQIKPSSKEERARLRQEALTKELDSKYKRVRFTCRKETCKSKESYLISKTNAGLNGATVKYRCVSCANIYIVPVGGGF